MRKKRSKLIYGLAFIVPAIVFTIFMTVTGTESNISPLSQHKAENYVRAALILNDTLTNESCDFEELKEMDSDFEQYLRSWGIHGATLAIVRNDSLVYTKGYGKADDGKDASPATLYRLASVSKLITAVGIMKLQEQGKLNLADKVFTPDGIFGDEPFTASISDQRYFDITIEDLLRHSAGFTTRAGDPMFSTRDIILQNHLSCPPDAKTLTGIVLKRKLGYNPGEGSDYSNFGYLLLSMIIEKISGEPYETWMQDNVLKPAGCVDMHIGGNYFEDRLPGESKYWPVNGDPLISCYDGSDRMVTRVYGGNDIKSLSGAGAWVSSVPELALLVSSIDNKKNIPDILKEESIARMTSPTDSVTYAIGWTDTKADGEWTRTGTLGSTAALIKMYPDGECWILVTNTGTWRGPRFSAFTNGLFKKSRDKYSSLLPSIDLFH